MKKVISLFLSFVMLFSITSGIDMNAYAASYNSDYRRWSQGKSSYTWMKNYGCWVVAESKLIYETGINKSSSFNPDVYYKWATNKGYVNNGGNVYSDNPVRYAKSLGNNKLTYKGVTTSNLSNKVINNAKSGYYSIIKVNTSRGNTHYIMANNSKTKSTGSIYIYDSWNSSNEPPATFAWENVKSKVGGAYTMAAVYTFQYSGSSTVTKPSVSVKAVSKVTSSSAQINFTANNPSKVTIKTVGVQVRKKGSSSWATKSEAMNKDYVNAASVPMWWTVGKGKEVNMTLSAGTTYEYRAYVVYNGTNYYSSISSFTTTGHSHNYNSSEITTNPTCDECGVKTYYCSCGATKTEPIAKLGHNYVTVEAVEPTCIECGQTEYKRCSRCGFFYNLPELTDPKGHNYKNSVAKATLSQNGEIVKRCSACGDVLNTTIYYPKTITLSTTSYTYNGKVKTTSVTVKDSKGETLKKNTDYTVTYAKGRKYVGKYTVTITFKGNYIGTVKKTFTIKPKSTSISRLTAGKKKFTVKWKKQSTQTTGYQIQYSTSSKFSSAKTVTVGSNKTTSKTISKLKSKKKYYVRVRTYKVVKINGKNTKIYSSWSKAKAITTKK